MPAHHQNDVTPEQWETFFDELAEFGNVTAAAERAGISRMTVYRMRKQDDDFRERFEETRRVGNDGLEDEARRRGAEGYDKPIYYKGIQTDTVREYSDSLMAMLLKGNHPKYRESRLEMSGPDGGPIELTDAQVTAKFAAMLEDARRRAVEAEYTDITDQPLLEHDGADLL